MSHIFISYARKDIQFAGRIVQALARHKLDSWIDWKSIPKGEDWEQEIYRGIERADAFLFLVSLSSVRSEMCNKEIVHAVEHGKRIIPIFIGDADVGDVNGKFHTSRAREEITKRNYVFCRDGVDDFDRAIEDTRNTIHTDYEWLKYHTDLLKKALEWDRNKDKSRLLTGRVLADAELRISRVEKEMKDPFPSLIQYQFIHASRAEEERARQSRNKIRNIITITFAALAAIAIMLAIGQYEQRQVALANALAARSQAELDQYPQRSLLLAAEALNISQVSAANEALLQAMTHVSGEGLDVRQGYITAVALSRDGQRAAVSASDGQIHLFDLSASDRSAVVLNGSEGVFLLLMFSPDGNRLAASGADTRILLWDFKAGGFSSSPVSITASSPVSNLFFDPNGAWLLVGNRSGAPERIKLGQSSAPLENLDGKGSDVSNLVMSSDGRWLAGSDPNGGILLWDLSTANPSVEKLGDASFTGTALAFSPDCHNLGAGGRNGIIKVWDLDRVAQPEVSLEGSLGPITQLVFSQDGRLLISGHDSTAQVWDLTRNLNSQILSAHEADITQLFITPDDHWLITTSMDGTLRRWDLLSDRPQDSSRAIYGHDSSILSAAMSADGRRLVTGSDDNTARLWDLFSLWDEDAFLVVLPGHTGDITSLAISSDSRLLATGSADQTIRLWDLTHPDSAQLPQILRLHEGDVKELDISPDGKWLISNGGNVMRLWDLTNEPPIPALIESHDGKVVDILLSPDSKWAFSASTPYTSDGVFTRWELGATDIAASRASKWGTIGMASGLAISSDGRWLAIGCGFYAPLNSTSVIPCPSQLVDLKEGQKEIRLPSEEGISTRTSTDTYTRVAFSPDVHWLVSTSDSIAVVFNMTAQKIEQSGFVLSAGGESLVDHYYPGSASIVDVRFSADGSWLAVQNKSNVISLWKTDSLQTDPVLFQTVGQVRALTFTADHLKLVAGDDQGRVYTWNLEDVNAEPSIFQDHSAAITTLAASPDGRWLVTGSEDQSVRLRAVKYLNAGSVKDIVCAKAGRNLSQMEWQQYFGDSGLQPVCSRWPLYQTLVNTTKETWRWKYLPVIAGFLKSGVIYCLGSILSLLVGWAIYELYEKAARWWRSW